MEGMAKDWFSLELVELQVQVNKIYSNYTAA